MKWIYVQAFLLAIIFNAPFKANSALIYDELIDGDIIAPGLLTVLDLSNGLNIISGQSSTVTSDQFPSTSPETDYDFFSFDIPTGFEAISIRYFFNSIISDPRLFSKEGIDIYRENSLGPRLVSTSFEQLNINEYVYSDNLKPIESGRIYNIFHKWEFGGVSGAWSIETDWKFEILLRPTSVPSPNTFMLFVISIIFLYQKKITERYKLE
jgi:hypothetical protein